MTTRVILASLIGFSFSVVVPVSSAFGFGNGLGNSWSPQTPTTSEQPIPRTPATPSTQGPHLRAVPAPSTKGPGFNERLHGRCNWQKTPSGWHSFCDWTHLI